MSPLTTLSQISNHFDRKAFLIRFMRGPLTKFNNEHGMNLKLEDGDILIFHIL